MAASIRRLVIGVILRSFFRWLQQQYVPN